MLLRRRLPLAALVAAWPGVGRLVGEDPYVVLGVPRSATSDEIRRAYKAKAAACHPDKGGDAEEFKRVAAAYATLSDPATKARHDGGGGVSQGEGFAEGFDPFRLFEDFFEHQFRPSAARRVVRLTLSLEELYKGGSRRVGFVRERACEACGGYGGPVAKCRTCGGLGHLEQRSSGFVRRLRCGACGGAGVVVVSPCTACGGRGRQKTRAEVEVAVAPGAEAGEAFDFRSEGDDVFDGSGRPVARRGLTVLLEEAEHPEFQRLGPHLLVAKRVSLLDALTGFVLDLPCVATGARLSASPPTGLPAKPDDIWVLRGAGMPARRQKHRGDLYVRIIVDFPQRLRAHPDETGATRAALAALIGGDPAPPEHVTRPSSRTFADFFRTNSNDDETRRVMRATPSEIEALFRERRRSS